METVSPSTDRIRAKPVHFWRRSICALTIVLTWFVAPPAAHGEIPSWLPRYDLGMRLEVAEHRVVVTERVTWTNHHARPAGESGVQRACSLLRPQRPDLGLHRQDAGDPPARSERRDRLERPAANDRARLSGERGHTQRLGRADRAAIPLSSRQRHGPRRSALPREVHQDEHVTVELTFTLRLPQRQGRWGQWEGVTFLAQWLPVLAFYDDQGWQPTPFIPWHQPFFNEAGIYTAHIDAAARPKSWPARGSVVGESDLGGGWKMVEVQRPGRAGFRGPVERPLPGIHGPGRSGPRALLRVSRARVLRPADDPHRRPRPSRLRAVVRPLPVSRFHHLPSRISAGTATSAAAW